MSFLIQKLFACVRRSINIFGKHSLNSGLDVSKIDKILADHQKFAVSGLPLI